MATANSTLRQSEVGQSSIGAGTKKTGAIAHWMEHFATSGNIKGQNTPEIMAALL